MQHLEFWRFLAGLGFFLFGMSQLESILKSISGRSLKLFLKRNTKNLFKSIAGGAIITGIVQSSTVVSLIVLAFVEAGVITFRNALGVILGTNLGTTLTAWIIAAVGFNLDVLGYSLPVIAVSAIGVFFFEKRKKLQSIFAVFFALGILFLGMSYMKEGSTAFLKDFDLATFSDYGTFIFVIVGFILTTIIQSSSATIAITLTAVYAGVLNFPCAAAIVIGSEVGTTIKILLWGMKGSPDKKRVAWGNFIYNIFTAIIAYIFLYKIVYFIENIVQIRNPLIGLAFFQSAINVLSIILFVPFLSVFAKWLENKFTTKENYSNSYVGAELPILPVLATDALRKETENLFQKTLQFNTNILCIEKSNANGWLDNLKSITQTDIDIEVEYHRLKQTEGDLLVYYSNIDKNNLEYEEKAGLLQYVNALRQCIYAAKSVKDIDHNIKEFDASANDIFNQQCAIICSEWSAFNSLLNQLISGPDKSKLRLALDEAMDDILVQNGNAKIEIIHQLKNNQLNEIEASTVLNVHRELLSCKKSLLLVVESIRTNEHPN